MYWPHTRCILCLEGTDLTVEHLIPEALGGRLAVRFLCKPCNSNLGHRIEATVKTDPSIRLAVEHLANELSDFAALFRENQRYLSFSAGGKVPGRIKKGGFRVDSMRQADGSLIQPSLDARKTIAKLIAKISPDPSAVQDALNRFDAAPEDSRVSITDNLEIVKWTVSKLEPLLDSDLLDDLVPLKIAYEYLACHLGGTIYTEDKQLEVLRTALRSGVIPDSIRIDHLHGQQYAAFHGLALQQDENHSFVRIRLFGWLAFDVHFLTLRYEGPRFVYTLDLKTHTHGTKRIDAPNTALERDRT
jgi:hypothetical protein